MATVEGRAESIKKKMDMLDDELRKHRDQMRKMREGPGKVINGEEMRRWCVWIVWVGLWCM